MWTSTDVAMGSTVVRSGETDEIFKNCIFLISFPICKEAHGRVKPIYFYYAATVWDYAYFWNRRIRIGQRDLNSFKKKIFNSLYLLSILFHAIYSDMYDVLYAYVWVIIC